MNLLELDIPIEIDSGGTMPELTADEHNLKVTFYLSNSDERGELSFESVLQFTFGYPNEEAITGHRYASLGLTPFNFVEVIGSEIIENIKSANRVHPYHTDGLFANYKHFVFPFHDTTLEVIAKSFKFG